MKSLAQKLGLGAVSTPLGYGSLALSSGAKGYWPCSEASGSIAYCPFDSSLNGELVGLTLYQDGPLGMKAVETDGSGRLNFKTANLVSAFNPLEGGFLIWAKVAEAANWTDGTERWLLSVLYDGGSYLGVYKPTANNTILIRMTSGFITYENGVLGTYSRLGYMAYGLRWSQSQNKTQGYISGYTLSESSYNFGSWGGDPVYMLAGMKQNQPVAPWIGGFSQVLFWDTCPSDAVMSSLVNVPLPP